MVVAEPRTRTSNTTPQAGADPTRAVRDYVRAYASLHGRRKAAEDLGVSRHTLWRFLERGHVGRAVATGVLSSVGGSVRAIEAATYEVIIDLEGLRPDPALRRKTATSACYSAHLPTSATIPTDNLQPSGIELEKLTGIRNRVLDCAILPKGWGALA